jgi:hypothetical protein
MIIETTSSNCYNNKSTKLKWDGRLSQLRLDFAGTGKMVGVFITRGQV